MMGHAKGALHWRPVIAALELFCVTFSESAGIQTDGNPRGFWAAVRQGGFDENGSYVRSVDRYNNFRRGRTFTGSTA